MSAEIRRDILELESSAKTPRPSSPTDTIWGEQEKFWAHEAKLNRGRNYIAVAAIAASITAAIIAALVMLL